MKSEAMSPPSRIVAILALAVLASCSDRPKVVAPPPEPVVAAPLVIAPLPFAHASMDTAKALEVFADDAMATRFLVLRNLVELSLAPDRDYVRRTEANKGALLPLTAPPPATGIDRPLPPAAEVVERFDVLSRSTRGTIDSRQAERDFLLEQILQATPSSRTQLHPPDVATARQLGLRLERLEAAGLITAEERLREAQALEELIASGVLPPVFYEPPKQAEAKPKPKPQGKPGGKSAGAGAGLGAAAPSPGGLTRSAGLRIDPLAPSATAPPAIPGQPAGVHLMSMANANFAQRAWDAMIKEHPELAPLKFKAVKADLGDLGMTYRLVAGPLDLPEAEKLCGTLRAKGQACIATTFAE